MSFPTPRFSLSPRFSASSAFVWKGQTGLFEWCEFAKRRSNYFFITKSTENCNLYSLFVRIEMVFDISCEFIRAQNSSNIISRELQKSFWAICDFHQSMQLLSWKWNSTLGIPYWHENSTTLNFVWIIKTKRFQKVSCGILFFVWIVGLNFQQNLLSTENFNIFSFLWAGKKVGENFFSFSKLLWYPIFVHHFFRKPKIFGRLRGPQDVFRTCVFFL